MLAHASKSARKLNDYFIVDIDAHVTETAFWSEVTDRIDNDYLRHAALSFRERGGSPPGLLNVQPGMLYQDMFGRIPHGQQSDAVIGEGTHRQVELVRRAMDSMGIDYTVAFPTPMLLLGMHPQAEVEVALGRAFNRWLVEELLPREPRIKAMMYLPFNDPEACVEVVEEFADAARRHRLHRGLDALQAGSSQQLHAALCRVAGDGQAAGVSLRLPLGR